MSVSSFSAPAPYHAQRVKPNAAAEPPVKEHRMIVPPLVIGIAPIEHPIRHVRTPIGSRAPSQRPAQQATGTSLCFMLIRFRHTALHLVSVLLTLIAVRPVRECASPF